MKKHNKLKIRAIDLDLELSGDPAYVQEAYEALRPVLMERFRASVDARPGQASSEGNKGSESRATIAPAPRKEGHAPVGMTQSGEHVNVVMTNEVYNKIYLVELEELGDAPITNAIDFEHVGRIYINRSQKEQFSQFFKVGKVLWRELTSAGKAAVKGSQ